MTLLYDSGVILYGKIRCLSLLSVKRLTRSTKPSQNCINLSKNIKTDKTKLENNMTPKKYN